VSQRVEVPVLDFSFLKNLGKGLGVIVRTVKDFTTHQYLSGILAETLQNISIVRSDTTDAPGSCSMGYLKIGLYTV
jgi:hypothetical protein